LRIDILLKEYDTLRAEIISRSNNRFATIGLIIALGAFVLTRPEESAVSPFVLAAPVLAILLVTLWRLGQLIKRCSLRIAEIEARINQLMGEELLAWEGRICKRLLFHKLHRRPQDVA
jgi:hypothetical protein